jgi:hypothetical protein
VSEVYTSDELSDVSATRTARLSVVCGVEKVSARTPGRMSNASSGATSFVSTGKGCFSSP